MTMARRCVSCLVLVVLLALASGASGRVAVRGAGVAAAGSMTPDGTPLQLMANGKIAFVDPSTNFSLDVINPDGSGLRRLVRCTTRACFDWQP